jgi:hypothetical protein
VSAAEPKPAPPEDSEMVTWVLARPAVKPAEPIAMPKVVMPGAPEPVTAAPAPSPLDGEAMVKEAR